eukprot:2853023-Prymnesium_polylepis.1
MQCSCRPFSPHTRLASVATPRSQNGGHHERVDEQRRANGRQARHRRRVERGALEKRTGGADGEVDGGHEEGAAPQPRLQRALLELRVAARLRAVLEDDEGDRS